MSCSRHDACDFCDQSSRNNPLFCMGDFVVNFCFSLSASKVDLVQQWSRSFHVYRFRFRHIGLKDSSCLSVSRHRHRWIGATDSATPPFLSQSRPVSRCSWRCRSDGTTGSAVFVSTFWGTLDKVATVSRLEGNLFLANPEVDVLPTYKLDGKRTPRHSLLLPFPVSGQLKSCG